MPTTTTLEGVRNWGDSLASDLLEQSLAAFFDWGFLGVGAFTNVTRNPGAAYGEPDQFTPSGLSDGSTLTIEKVGSPYPPARLRCVRDPYYQIGQVWEAARQNWVWESGVQYPVQPTSPSGVWVNGTLLRNGTPAPSSYHFDYPRGRVVFDKPIPAASVVECEYAYRVVRVAPLGNAGWFQEIQFGSLHGDDPTFPLQGSGAWTVLADNRVQLPALVVQAVPSVTLKGYEVGSLTRWHYQDVLFHVLAETDWERKQLHDAVVNQWQKSVWGLDTNRMDADNRFPLTRDGAVASGATTYPQLAAPSGQGGYAWKLITFAKVSSEEAPTSAGLYRATVRVAAEVIL